MRFECRDQVGQPAAEVHRLLRDSMPAVVPYLPDIRAVHQLERREAEDGLRLVNLWQASNDKTPRMIRRFTSPDLMSWKDHAWWPTDPPLRTEWRLEPKVGGSLFTCSGCTTIESLGENRCVIHVVGELQVYPARFPGVPRLLARKLKGPIESFVIGLVVPNLKTLARGVQGYFNDPGNRAPAP